MHLPACLRPRSALRSAHVGAFIGCAVLAALAFGMTTASAQTPARRVPPGVGVMIHYLPDKAQIDDINQIDVEALADALVEMKAGYLVLTLGQNNGQFIAPNPTLASMCPEAARNASPRDLPLELGRALRRRAIALILYLPFRAPQADPYLMACLGDVSEQSPPPATFIANWSRVIGDWSAHYGALASGWWFDGTYNTDGMTPGDWRTLCSAINRGASGRLVAFNPGEGDARYSMPAAPCQNWMAGELMAMPTAFRPVDSTLRFHVLTPITASWSRPGTARFSAPQLASLIATAKARGGSITLDMPLDSRYAFFKDHVALVRKASGQ